MTVDKKKLTEILTNAGIIKQNTEQVIINCNSGSISDLKVVERFK